MTSLSYQQRNTQAVKVILSELYVTWATSDGGMLEIQKAVEELLSAAQKQRHTNGAPADGLLTSNQPSSQSQSQAQRSGEPFPAHHVDPHGRSASPPPSPPGRPRRRGPDDVSHTPSPVQAARFFGVDELDFSHRAVSPGGSSPAASPSSQHHVRPVVDPMAPVPHVGSSSSGTISPPAAHSLGGANFDTSINTAMVVGEVFNTLDTSNLGGSITQSQRFVHSSGSFASMPPENVKRATVNDIPIFYSAADTKGVRKTLPEVEEEALKNFFAIKGSAVNRKVLSGSTLPMDTTKTVRKGQFGKLCQDVFRVPTWMKDALFRRIALASGTTESVALTYDQISKFYYNVFGYLTVNRRLFELIRTDPKSEFLTLQDFKDTVRYLVDSHPGLEFLKQPEFQEYYCRTVAIRIMYALERQQSGRISWFDFDRSDLPEVMQEVDEKDVNLVLQYFSYEHFYVLYCKFWELDTDRDQLVGFDDLCKYGQGSICMSVLKRVVEGAGRPLTSGEPGKLDFEDFVYFCLSEEDKNSNPAVYYWFRVLDVDGDGILSGYELYEFYQENNQRFLEYVESPDGDLSYADMMCQMMDMLGFWRMKDGDIGITLSDLRACPTPSNFFNMVFNAPKFMLFEHRDPFSEHQQRLKPEKTDWDRFARAEYDRMASEAQ
ncbi:protein phosphatase 2 (formerly 2A), regulatory subunit B [Trypanosoma theileri]|uniref:Protein phosphatase 2 (Formerly 2A), regulatory subunit B n=1 Tax=Trypanosoma theileri TaxID=67003 RepID=A0A1X0P683_9TRYP|nr:protein phosphatase 2 (formerly 2A), regulatory subunit B [Trypanosoma theileri]ORC92143.1 protein phosphatase 2 (formerly 2A), regulatory subunit B [Trypanosoma theileri]